MLAEIIKFVKIYRQDIILVAGVVLISLLSFAAGYIAAKNYGKEPVKFEDQSGHIDLTNPLPYVSIYEV